MYKQEDLFDDQDTLSVNSSDSYEDTFTTNKRKSTTRSTTRSGVKKTINKKDVSTSAIKRENDGLSSTNSSSPIFKKAGRKPLEKAPFSHLPNDPKLKRKAQNRAAQRAFRERKERFVSELQEQIDLLEKEKAENKEQWMKENAQLKEELKQLREENTTLKESPFAFEFPTSLDHLPIIDSLKDIASFPDTNANIDISSASPTSTRSTRSTSDDSINVKPEYETDSTHYSLSSPNFQHYSEELLSSSCSEEPSPQTKILSREEEAHSPEAMNPHLYYATTNYQFDLPSLEQPSFNDGIYNNSYGTSSLFHGKDDFVFQDYRVPLNDDFLIHGDALPPLFGSDHFDLSASAPYCPSLDATSDFSLLESTRLQNMGNKVNPQRVIESLLMARSQSNVYGIDKEPLPMDSIDIDKLCEDLKAKATCKGYCPLADKLPDEIIEYSEKFLKLQSQSQSQSQSATFH
ncbi:hypothetical protein BDF14DRAFT_1863143 [Spinellus fusiger]|nr:hypothetical protein BDF14DRAFT_1863143 [Spinellus fusiger]